MNHDNAPDDDARYNRTCPAGHSYHASGGCVECDMARERAAADPCECGHVFEDGDFVYDRHEGWWIAVCNRCEREVWR